MIEIGNGIYVRKSIKHRSIFFLVWRRLGNGVFSVSVTVHPLLNPLQLPLVGPLAKELITRNSSSHILEKQFKGKFELAYLQNYKG